MKNEDRQTQAARAEKPGFFRRMVDKIDTAMKEKADAKAEEGCCCGPSDSAAESDPCCAPSGKHKKGKKCC